MTDRHMRGMAINTMAEPGGIGNAMRPDRDDDGHLTEDGKRGETYPQGTVPDAIAAATRMQSGGGSTGT